jgi:hypothetical protein
MLVNPISKKPFYIGKGKEKRAWNHLSEHENVNHNKQLAISEIRDKGLEPIVVIIQDNLYELVALRIESYLINSINGLSNIVKPKYIDKIIGVARIESPKRFEEVHHE